MQIETFSAFLTTAPAFLSRKLPDLSLAPPHDRPSGGRAGQLVGVVVADFHSYLASMVELEASEAMLDATRCPRGRAIRIRYHLGLGREPIPNTVTLAERLGVFVTSSGSQAGPLFVAGMSCGSPVAAIAAGPDSTTRRWAIACAIGALGAHGTGDGIEAAFRTGAELLIPEEGLKVTHRADSAVEENAARWGVPAGVYAAVARRHGLRSSARGQCGKTTEFGWEQSTLLAGVLARLRQDGLRLSDVALELGYPPSVLHSLVRGLVLSAV